MSLLKLACVILAMASIASASIGAHYDFAPHLHYPGSPIGFAPPALLAPPVLPTPVIHAPAPPPFWPAPILSAPAPLWPAPAPAPLWPAPAPAPLWPAPAPVSYYPAPAPLPLPLPLTKPLPPLFESLPFAPAYRAIPGPVTKTHHLSVGFAYPAKVIAAPAPHVHPVKIIAQPSHAHIHAHSAPLISLPHHHHHVIA